MFDLDEKLQCDRFCSDLVRYMDGKGEMSTSNLVLRFELDA